MTMVSRANELLAQLRKSYIAELPGKLEELELLIIALERDDNFQAGYDELFRKVHSFKGGAGTYGLPILSTICHRLEDHLRLVDKKVSRRHRKHIDNWLAHVDLMRQAFNGIAAGRDTFPEIEAALDKLCEDAFPAQRRVAVVVQSRTATLLCAQVLAPLRAHSVEFNDGLQALERLLRDKFDLLLASVEISSLNGVALLAALRLSTAANRNLPAVLLTSRAGLEVPQVVQPVCIIAKGANLAENLESEVTRLLAT